MFQQIIDKSKPTFDVAILHLADEFKKIRTGRANTGILDDIRIDAYGSLMPLNQVASVSIPEARLLMIQPWDRSQITAIELAIQKSGLGLQPNNDGVVIRLALPPLTEETRKQLVKTLNVRSEDARIAVRSIREDVWKEIQKAEESGDITEDEKFRAKDVLQELVDEKNKEIESMRKQKEEEVMTV